VADGFDSSGMGHGQPCRADREGEQVARIKIHGPTWMHSPLSGSYELPPGPQPSIPSVMLARLTQPADLTTLAQTIAQVAMHPWARLGPAPQEAEGPV
jgi:hypothetical protein